MLQSIQHNWPVKTYCSLSHSIIHTVTQESSCEQLHFTSSIFSPSTVILEFILFQAGKLFNYTLFMHKPFTDALTTKWSDYNLAEQKSHDQVQQHFVPSRPPCQMHAHTRRDTHTKWEKSYKNEGGLFQQALRKVARTYQRLRQKAACIQVPVTNDGAPVSTAIHGIEKIIQLCYSTVRGRSRVTAYTVTHGHKYINALCP